MQAICTYHIRLEGEVNEADFNAGSPLTIHVIEAEVCATLLAVQTDQSGIIGLMRYLHSHGFMLLSVVRIMEKEND